MSEATANMQGRSERKARISLIVPTRGRPENLIRLSQSLRANTAEADRVELVLVIDEDDQSYDGLELNGLWVTKVPTAPGLTMGNLNLAGYHACSGDYIMLLNDDVIVRTQDWDRIILGVYHDHPDGVLLVHVNDRIFESRLCTFPFLTRKFCTLAGGIYLPGYRRYRIDDHIYNVFNLLSVLGHNRIVYLPEVVFEHLNSVTDEHGVVSYQLDPVIHEADTLLFDAALAERKTLALQLAEVIDTHRRKEESQCRAQLLAPIHDWASLRRPEFVRTLGFVSVTTSSKARATIGVVSADIQSVHAQTCLQAIRLYTSNYDRVILDNNHGPDFNHSREMNRLITTCRTDYLVLLDDDVIVEPGWLDRLLSASGPGVGVVTPLHKSTDGKLSYAGIVMGPDYSSQHTHAFALFPRAFAIQTLCSAVMLIDINKCGHSRMDESYSEYFLDIDFGLRV